MDLKTPSCIVVYGPTGSGKSALAVSLAHEVDGEIISADSRQIYRFLNIGTGKITKEEMEEIPHYCLDILDPKESYSVSDFKKTATKLMEDIWNRGKTPILCGGTGLYIDSVIYDLDVEVGSNDDSYRQELEEFRQKNGNEALWNLLFEKDPEYAKEIHPNSYPYVMRGLEVLKTTGKSKSTFKKERVLKYPTIFKTPFDGDREALYSRINTRIEKMFQDGLVTEVENLLQNGYSKHDPGLGSIGYPEVIEFLEWTISKEEAIKKIQQFNRNYAKRQITWCKRYT